MKVGSRNGHVCVCGRGGGEGGERVIYRPESMKLAADMGMSGQSCHRERERARERERERERARERESARERERERARERERERARERESERERVRVCVCIFVYTHIHSYIYILNHNTHTHTHTHTHTYMEYLDVGLIGVIIILAVLPSELPRILGKSMRVLDKTMPVLKPDCVPRKMQRVSAAIQVNKSMRVLDETICVYLPRKLPRVSAAIQVNSGVAAQCAPVWGFGFGDPCVYDVHAHKHKHSHTHGSAYIAHLLPRLLVLLKDEASCPSAQSPCPPPSPPPRRGGFLARPRTSPPELRAAFNAFASSVATVSTACTASRRASASFQPPHCTTVAHLCHNLHTRRNPDAYSKFCSVSNQY
jgi:hypothetical protein